MKLRVTVRQLTSEMAEEDIMFADETGVTIYDSTARTIADWYKTPNTDSKNLVALAQGTEFDMYDLLEEVERAGLYPDHYSAIVNWANEKIELYGEEGGL